MKNILAVSIGTALELARDDCLSVSRILRRNEPDGDDSSIPGRTDCALHSGVPSGLVTRLRSEPQNQTGRLIWMESPQGAPYALFKLAVPEWSHEVLLPLASHSVRHWLMELRLQAEMCLMLSSREGDGGSVLRVPLGREDFPEEIWAGIWRKPKKSQLKNYFQTAVIFAAERALRRGSEGEEQEGVVLRHSVSVLVPDEVEIDRFDGLRALLPTL